MILFIKMINFIYVTCMLYNVVKLAFYFRDKIRITPLFNPISSGISEQREAPGGGLGDPHYLIPVKQKIEISALVQWHIYSK